MDEKVLKILIVDDDEDTRRLTARFLQSVPATCVTAGSGMEGIAISRKERPDLIFLDAMMPDMNGYQVCARLQNHPGTANVPVIFLTSLGEAQDKARALAAGAADYLVKPVSKEKLHEAVRKHSDTKRRWYSVRLATDLWDEAPLPQKFNHFRELLSGRAGLPPDVVRQIQALKGTEAYR
ncbi:MAG: response regulator receiver protein, partial [Armatimonadetes bacterium]|nr:response regulator receiver protein [Armatimonadota bacterium]